MTNQHQFRLLAQLRLLQRRRVGLFGGSFNPAHAGHAHVADTVVRALQLHQIWWLVTPQNPFKTKAGLADTATRVLSAQASMQTCQHKNRMTISRLEESLPSRRTADTIRLIHRACPRLRLYWVMGADNMAAFHLWHDIRHLTRHLATVVINRPGFAAPAVTSPMANRLKRIRPSRLRRHHRKNTWCFIQWRVSPLSATAIRTSTHQQRNRSA